MKRLSVIAAFGLTVLATQASAGAACVTPNNVNAMATQIFDGVNQSRRANGKSQLNYNPTLGQAAMSHACDMLVNDFFSHEGTGGTTVQARVRRAGYQDCLVAENIAWGYPTAGQIVTGWMNSPGHRSNMLHARATEMGIGITQGPKGPNWVLVVAKPC